MAESVAILAQAVAQAALAQTLTASFSSGLDAVVLIHLFLARCLLLLAGNCLPYHQPELPANKDTRKALGLSDLFWHLDSTYCVENSLGYLRSGFSGWNFLRLQSELFPCSLESSLAHWIRDLWVFFVGTWILLTLVENSLGFLRSGFSGWNFFRFGA